MIRTSLHLSEQSRLLDLHEHNIIDSDPELEFDELVELAAQICGCPMAAISFVDESRQWFKARKGIDHVQTARDISFCQFTIRHEIPFVVPDAFEDKRFCESPLVISGPKIRFYAGMPIRSEKGNNLGAICVMDHVPQYLSAAQTKSLSILSRQASRLLQLRKANQHLHEYAITQREDHRSLIKSTVLGQERFVQSISTELHENIAQGLAATKLYLEMAEREPDPFLIRKSKEQVTTLIRDTVALSRKVYPTTVKWLDHQDVLEQSLEDYGRDTGICVKYSSSVPVALSAEIWMALQVILNEQLKNIREHANATQVHVSVRLDKKELVQTIRDNGAGFDVASVRKKSGFNKIGTLATCYGGTAEVEASSESGCMLAIRIPGIAV
jgi:signal transduction histidine kinase